MRVVAGVVTGVTADRIRAELSQAMSVAGVTAFDVFCSVRFSADGKRSRGNGQSTARPKRHQVRKSITINRPAEKIYVFWRDLENLPRFMNHLKAGDIDPSYVVTHTLSLEEAPKGYPIFCDKQDECIRVVLKP